MVVYPGFSLLSGSVPVHTVLYASFLALIASPVLFCMKNRLSMSLRTSSMTLCRWLASRLSLRWTL